MTLESRQLKVSAPSVDKELTQLAANMEANMGELYQIIVTLEARVAALESE